MKHITILFIALLSLASSCQKDNIEPQPELPPATTTGENTFGCYINGVPWVASVPPFCPTCNKISAGYDTFWSRLGIQSNKEGFENGEYVNETMSIGVITTSIGIYDIKKHDSNLIYWENTKSCYSYSIDTFYAHQMTLTRLDFQNRIVAGSFECRMISNECMDTLYITEGRFDVRFNY